MKKTIGTLACALALASILTLQSGCTYCENRTNDFLDMADFGLTANATRMPQFSCFADIMSLTPIGYSNFDGRIVGVSGGEVGCIQAENKACGVLLWGNEQHGAGDPPLYRTGVVHLATSEEMPPPEDLTAITNSLHLGWLGLDATLRPLDMVDFILGLATIDIIGDDKRSVCEEVEMREKKEADAKAFSKNAAYWENRKNDTLDMFRLGLTYNEDWKPQFGIFFDFFSLLPLGYSNFDGKVAGIASRQIGVMDYEHKSWGYWARGQAKETGGVFNPKDPHQARPDQADLTEAPTFDTGFARDYHGENRPPLIHFVQCDRLIHLGWVGIHLGMCPFDMFDFALGWTTFDFMNDDIVAAGDAK